MRIKRIQNLKSQLQAARKESSRRLTDIEKQAAFFNELIDEKNRRISIRQSEIKSQQNFIKKLTELRNLVAEGKDWIDKGEDREILLDNKIIKNQSEIRRVSTNFEMPSQFENIIQHCCEEKVKAEEDEMCKLNSEESKLDNSKSMQMSIPEIKIESKIDIKNKQFDYLNLDNRRDSDQELANILANAIFQDSWRSKNQSTIKEESMSAFIKDADRMPEDTKDIIVPSSPWNQVQSQPKKSFL